MNYLSVLFFTQGVSKIKVLISLKCYKNIYVTWNSEILHYDRLKNYLWNASLISKYDQKNILLIRKQR